MGRMGYRKLTECYDNIVYGGKANLITILDRGRYAVYYRCNSIMMDVIL